MRGFQFRLDSVRRVRSAELDARQADLQRARQQLDASLNLAAQTDDHARLADEALASTLSAGIGGEGLRAALEARAALGRAATAAKRAVEESANAEKLARSAVTEAWRRTRSLETLRERALALWRGEQSRREQREDDERAVRRSRLPMALLAMSLLMAAPTASRAEDPTIDPPVASNEIPAETLQRILSELRVREQALERRERDVAQRERVAAELSADARLLLAELDAIRAQIDQRVGSSDAEAGARIARLAKTYSEMEPNQAAPILEELDADLATSIVSKMKPKKSAAVLAQMSRKTALRMSELAANPLDEPSTRSTP